MAKIMVGTCGFYYTDWLGSVYPEGTAKKDYLSLYAERFSTVELDYTYYSMPKAENLAKMLVDGGPNLTFSAKAHQSLTHKIDPGHWKGEAETYRGAIDPLLKAGRLEAVLFQFPYSFHYTADNRRYLGDVLSCFQGVPLAVEFRVAEWYHAKVIEGMRKQGAALVSLDMPDLAKLPPAMDVVTAPFAYIRLHGRNAGAWWGSDEVARYDYLYNDRELEAWVDRIKRIEVQADKILVYFNNHARGQAAKNGQSLIEILKRAGGKDMEHGEHKPGGMPS
ncbi:DUF72 domain-containing protein [Leadbettera azotonutricia]|uniref:DUF72 domain-containing protein n=1 Tax=Leadbettera azotonutricia (strain ATCC BAA-888 / DSM 13862 / ZAS-9) TaxID=545695 RepID=F5Y7M9_LEAAZ|nr:DUF72 domain-containing protein [Leadbettera azotonutricia]AEF80548.1 protein of unknown function DUF72 [Leadbettera azotonutricia ZAS-9]